MASDPNVSAVVYLAAAKPPGEGDGTVTQQDIAKTKAHFTSTGFEVHAPLGLSFSIGGKRSLFERVFGQSLNIDEENLGVSVTTEGGSLELPLEGLPGEIKQRVRAVTFMPPPPLMFADS